MTPQTVHVHHWIIAEPAGSTSEGVCKTCKVTRDFKNGTEEISFLEAYRYREALSEIRWSRKAEAGGLL